MRGQHLHGGQLDPAGGRGGWRMRRCCAPLQKGRWAEWVVAKLYLSISEAPAALLPLPGSGLPTLSQDYRTAPYWNLSVNPSV